MTVRNMTMAAKEQRGTWLRRTVAAADELRDFTLVGQRRAMDGYSGCSYANDGGGVMC